MTNRSWRISVAAVLLLGLTQCTKRDKPVSEDGATPSPVPQATSADADGGKRVLRGATPPDPALAVPTGFPALPDHPREFDALSADERAALDRLTAEFRSSGDPARRAAILDEIDSSYYGEEVLAFVGKVLELGDEALSLRAVEMLAGNTTAAIIPILENALRDPSENVRASAAMAVAEVRDDAVVGFLGKVFEDESADVRLTGLSALEPQTETRKLKILGRALEATHSDVPIAAITELQVESSARGVEVLFNALGSSDPEVQEEARFSIDFMLGEEFATPAEARAWWSANKQRFDQNLAPNE